MISNDELDRLDKQALAALQGYNVGVNVTCYVYGADVLTLVKEVRELQADNRQLREAIEKASPAFKERAKA